MSSDSPSTKIKPPLITPALFEAIGELTFMIQPRFITKAFRSYSFSLEAFEVVFGDIDDWEMSSEELFRAYVSKINWTSEEVKNRYVNSFSQILRLIYWNRPDPDDNPVFYFHLAELERAARENGYTVDPEGNLVLARDVDTSIVELIDLEDKNGIRQALERIQESIYKNLDASDVIARSKNLVESIASTILVELEVVEVDDLEGMKFGQKVSECLKALGLNNSRQVEGLGQVIGGLNNAMNGLTKERNDGVVGHGQYGWIESDELTAGLALGSARAWSNFVLSYYKDNKDKLLTKNELPF